MTDIDVSAVIADQQAKNNEGKQVDTKQQSDVDIAKLVEKVNKIDEYQNTLSEMQKSKEADKVIIEELKSRLAKAEESLKKNNDEHMKLRRGSKDKNDKDDEESADLDKQTVVPEKVDAKSVIESLKITALKRENDLISKVIELKGNISSEDRIQILAISSTFEDDRYELLSKKFLSSIEKKIKDDEDLKNKQQAEADEEAKKQNIKDGTATTPENYLIPVGDGKLSYAEINDRYMALAKIKNPTSEQLQAMSQYRQLLSKITFGV